MAVPGPARLPGRIMAHQSLGAFSSSSSTSKCPRVRLLRARNRAGMTRESLSTSRSPGEKYSGKSPKSRCVICPWARSKTSKRA